MPANRLSVHYLPQFVSEADFAGEVVAVIDLVRASTTICQALHAGATEVVAYLEVGDLIRDARRLPGRDEVVLGGERGGLVIEGFDLGNSPAEYTPDQVFGRRVLFTTTNGTMALQHTRLASRVIVAALVNLTATVRSLAGEEGVHLLCAGASGHVAREDRLAAGAIAHELASWEGAPREMNDQAVAVLGEWEELLNTARALGRSPTEQLAIELRDTPGGRNLVEVGLEADLPLCAAIDTLDLVPVFDPATRRITAP
ncbi:2-phosphosulfolactate phosphatase [Botrimarina hoheduenensis]|uniref:Probable 2-phosphosulfolactate phosphatase n=1 Tax=Botrimarina hoheduenensis TaxID=2528000 RepID=A0A5C5VZZ5_9BACT|nr:2-phosphosulfolactate phosphatase [Botrimarina hoheduenensis]TWT43369.1 putative 2-phosphosulfolactate phosphatase [Botrimarina hoheduenensis]